MFAQIFPGEIWGGQDLYRDGPAVLLVSSLVQSSTGSIGVYPTPYYRSFRSPSSLRHTVPRETRAQNCRVKILENFFSQYRGVYREAIRVYWVGRSRRIVVLDFRIFFHSIG